MREHDFCPSSPPLRVDPKAVGALQSDPEFAALVAWIFQYAGLAPNRTSLGVMALKIQERMLINAAKNCSEYWALLRESAYEIDEMIVSLSVGETYFFRNPEQFQALERIIYPELIRRKAAERRLAFWSAGCAKGAEPYSLAIQVRSFYALMGWSVSILGTDIHRSNLQLARDGRYTAWDLRGVPEEVITRCFQTIPKHSDKQYQLLPTYRGCVNFQRHNLVGEEYPHPSGAEGFDLILCRNVLIYFHSDEAESILRGLWDKLAPGGCLMLGPVECTMQATLRAVGDPVFPAASLFQKGFKKKAGRAAPPTSLPPLREKGVTPPLPRSAPPEPSLKPASAPGTMTNARTLFQTAIVSDLQGQAEEADRLLGAALYVDHKHVPSHYYRGLLNQRRGAAKQARRSYENALRILVTLPSDTDFPEWEGMQAPQLVELITLQLQALGAGEGP